MMEIPKKLVSFRWKKNRYFIIKIACVQHFHQQPKPSSIHFDTICIYLRTVYIIRVSVIQQNGCYFTCACLCVYVHISMVKRIGIERELWQPHALPLSFVSADPMYVNAGTYQFIQQIKIKRTLTRREGVKRVYIYETQWLKRKR